MLEGSLAVAAFLILGLFRVPLAIAMGVVGFVGFALKVNFNASAQMVAQIAYETGMNYTLSVIPLFILMGNFVIRAGLAEALYNAAYAFLGHRRGGLAMATIIACAAFGSVCGSSIATAATMGKVAYPAMRRFGYRDGLAVGSVAAGGTLGIMIPPSTIFVIYGVLTETSIGKLFAAGILPGLLGALLLCIAVMIVTWLDPKAGPPSERQNWRSRLRSLESVWGVLVLFASVMGGLYGGVFTATEAAGVGAGGAFLLAVIYRGVTWEYLFSVLVESARTTAMLFMLLIGALIFSNYINYTTLPTDLRDLVLYWTVPPLVSIALICAIYVILGTAMDELTMILLTVPVFYPLLISMGLDPIWFGVLIVCVMEIGMISPPVGMNIFVLRTVIPDVPLGVTYRGVLPFVAADTVRLAILIAFPAISLFLPSFMK
jgi:tripartite ATP-independent transporter DctM subunit